VRTGFAYEQHSHSFCGSQGLEEGEEGHTTAALFYALATASPRRRGHLTSHPLHTKMCASAPRKAQTKLWDKTA